MEKSEASGGGGAAVSADPVAGGAFSQLLFSVEETAGDNRNRDGVDGVFNFSASAFYSADEKPPKMLCFGDYDDKIKNVGDLVFVNETIPNCGGVITCSTTTDSSSPPSSANNNSSTNSVPMSSNRKRNGCNGNQPVGQSLTSRSQRNCKKARSSENSTTGGHAKVKKERLGERIAALQQLVSPFGKTDTASVLHEAMGYIKFLQAQVQVLCSPYLQRLPSNSSTLLPLLHEGCEENGEVESKGKDLRSRGLCLVPVECTLQVAESNGADFWSPASTVNNASSDHH